MSPLAQRIISAFDAKDRNATVIACEEVDKLVMRQRLPAPGPTSCTCGAATISAPASHRWDCPLRVWGS